MVRQWTTQALALKITFCNLLTSSQREQHKGKGKQKQTAVLIISRAALFYHPRSITDKENHHPETDTDATDKCRKKKLGREERNSVKSPPQKNLGGDIEAPAFASSLTELMSGPAGQLGRSRCCKPSGCVPFTQSGETC